MAVEGGTAKGANEEQANKVKTGLCNLQGSYSTHIFKGIHTLSTLEEKKIHPCITVNNTKKYLHDLETFVEEGKEKK